LFTDEVYGLSYLYSLKTAFFSTPYLPGPGLSDGLWHRSNFKSTQSILCSSSFCRSGLVSAAGLPLEGIIRETACSTPPLLWLGVIDHPLADHAHEFSRYLGIIYSYLPSWSCHLFRTLEKLDIPLLEAAADLRQPPWRPSST